MPKVINNFKNQKATSDKSHPVLPRWIIFLCLLISIAGIMDHDLWTPDEPREAAIALSMNRSGNILIPELAEKPFVEKPPLYYILASSAISLLGPIVGVVSALRLTSAFWGLGTLGMTWLLAKRMMKRDEALFSVLILATMPGFIHVTHWLLVDNALVFFIVAALWAFAEAYEGEKARFLPLAGLFTAGAFLSKGLIGPLIIGLGWLGLILPIMFTERKKQLMSPKWIILHTAAFIAFAVPALVWAINFKIIGGPELWMEWFWTNHFGRFSGQAKHLGHIKGPFYYLERAPVAMLPWIAIAIIGLVGVFHKARRRLLSAQPWPFLLCWGIGGLLLLSLSSTKRDIYLIILLPAFAMMIAPVLTRLLSPKHDFSQTPDSGFFLKAQPWARGILSFWAWLMIAVLGIVAAAPLSAAGIRNLSPRLWEKIGAVFSDWSMINSMAVLCVFLMVFIMTRKHLPFLHKWFTVNAFTYIMLLVLLCPMVDRVKSYEDAFRAMGNEINSWAADKEVALWNADETTRAGFCFYLHMKFKAISDVDELVSTLNGSHPRFKGVIVSSKNFPPQEDITPSWRTIKKVKMGPRRDLSLIEGGE